MATVRDRVLPPLNRAREVIDRLGLRRYRVYIVHRKWTGGEIGDGDAIDAITEITPAPKVRLEPAYEAQKSETNRSGGEVEERYFRIEKITPRFTSPTVGGYEPKDLDFGVVSPSEERLLILLGDDGVRRECTIVNQEFDRAFRYTLIVRTKIRNT